MVNLDDFMIEVNKESGLTFREFHAALRIITDRNGRSIYQEIKNGEMSVQKLAFLLRESLVLK